MRGWNIAGVTAESMATEAEKFYEIVKDLMKQAVPDKAQFCEFVFYDGKYITFNHNLVLCNCFFKVATYWIDMLIYIT